MVLIRKTAPAIGRAVHHRFLQPDNNYIGRPVDVMNMPDGSILISDDWNGAVYRVSYGRKTANR